MSDSEDDYMSDKLIPVSNNDIRPGLLFNQNLKRQHEADKKRTDELAKKPKKVHEIEHELREKGLNTALSSDNKGFRLLEKMGFKPGEGLGKSKSGVKEPIKITLKQGTSGIGREKHLENKIKLKKELKSGDFMKTMNEFQQSRKERTVLNALKKDFFKAQKICEELDFRKRIDDPIEEFYWTLNTMKLRRNLESEEEEDEFQLEFEEFINEDNLFAIIDYLRANYLYCIYCGFEATDEDDLKTNCPGSYRVDHDDE